MTYSLKIFLPIHWDFSLQGFIQTRAYSMDFAELAVFIKCFSMSLNVTGGIQPYGPSFLFRLFQFFLFDFCNSWVSRCISTNLQTSQFGNPRKPQSPGIANQMYLPSKLFLLFLTWLIGLTATLSSSPWCGLRVSLLLLLLFASM